VQPELQRSLGPLLGLTQLNTRIRWRTPANLPAADRHDFPHHA